MLKHHQTRPTRSAQRSMRLALLAGCSLCLLGLLILVGGSTGVARAATSTQLASQTSPQHPMGNDPGPAGQCYQSDGTADSSTDVSQACADLADSLSQWYQWLAIAIVAIGCIWIFAGAFQAAGKTGEGDFSSWMLVLDRLKMTALVFFVMWRLNTVLNIIEGIWYNHVNDQTLHSTKETGLPSGGLHFNDSIVPPTSLATELWSTLIVVLIQTFLIWVVIRILFTSLQGITSLAGEGRHPLGPIVMEVTELLGLGMLIVFLPSIITWLLPLVINGNSPCTPTTCYPIPAQTPPVIPYHLPTLTPVSTSPPTH